MRILGARLATVDPGRTTIELPFRADLCQQDGLLHAGVIASLLDSACGYAAMTLMPHGVEVLSVEFKVSFLSPARGSRFLARGRVVRAGRTITTCAGDLYAVGGRSPTLVATMLATMIGRAPARSAPGAAPRGQ